MGRLNLAKIKERRKELKNRMGTATEFLRFEDDETVVRPLAFAISGLAVDSAEDDDVFLDRKTGTHFGIEEVFGATEQYVEEGRVKTRKIQAIRCAVYNFGVYADEDADEITRTLEQDSRTVLNDAEIDKLDEWCRVCALVERTKADAEDEGLSDEDKALIKRLRVKPKYLMNVIDRSATEESEDGAIKIAEWGVQAYKRLLDIADDKKYEDALNEDASGRDFTVKRDKGKSGRWNEIEYSAIPAPDRSDIGNPSGKRSNLLDKEWAERFLSCWSLDDQDKIVAGELVIRPDRSDKKDLGPPPKCFNKGAKDDSPQCNECPWNASCDVADAQEEEAAPPPPADPPKRTETKKGADKPATTAGGSILDRVRAKREAAAAAEK